MHFIKTGELWIKGLPSGSKTSSRPEAHYFTRRLKLGATLAARARDRALPINHTKLKYKYSELWKTQRQCLRTGPVG